MPKRKCTSWGTHRHETPDEMTAADWLIAIPIFAAVLIVMSYKAIRSA